MTPLVKSEASDGDSPVTRPPAFEPRSRAVVRARQLKAGTLNAALLVDMERRVEFGVPPSGERQGLCIRGGFDYLTNNETGPESRPSAEHPGVALASRQPFSW